MKMIFEEIVTFVRKNPKILVLLLQKVELEAHRNREHHIAKF